MAISSPVAPVSRAPLSTAEPRSFLVHDERGTAHVHQVSWGAILAGAVAALVIQIVASMVGIGIGLSALDASGATENPTAGGFSLGAGLWWVVSGIVASLVGGYLAGRLSGRPSVSTGGYHGLVSWAVTTLVVLYLLSSAVGGLIGGAFGTVASAVGGAGQAIGGTAQTAAQAAAPSLTKLSNPFDGIESQVRQSSGGQDPAQLRDVAVSSLRAALTGDAAQKKAAEDRAVEALAKAQNIPADQARTQVQTYQQQYTQAVADAKAKGKAAAEATRSAAAQGALYAALALILGAVAALLGGRMGTVRSDTVRA